jgi:hypothetical protein
MRRLFLAVLVAGVVAPASAAASVFTIEAIYGIARPPSADLRSAVEGARAERDLAEDSLQIVGGDVLLNLGGLQLGAIVDTTIGDGINQTAVGGLVGFRVGDKLRLDLLGEVGGHRFGNVLDDRSVVTASSRSDWLLYVGVRPGVAYRIDLAPGSAGIIVGVWGFARWDVTDSTVPVTVADPSGSSPANLDLGGTSIGATLRFGLEL